MHSWTALGAAVAIHQRTVDRLVQRVYDQPLINNAERGAYVEHMIALALKGKGWDLTWPWASWDLEHLRWPEEKRPRIEVKQSAARAPDHAEKRPNPPPKTPARFSIKAQEVLLFTGRNADQDAAAAPRRPLRVRLASGGGPEHRRPPVSGPVEVLRGCGVRTPYPAGSSPEGHVHKPPRAQQAVRCRARPLRRAASHGDQGAGIHPGRQLEGG